MVGGVFSIHLTLDNSEEAQSSSGAVSPCAFTGGPENSLVQVASQAVLEGHPSWSPIIFTGPTGTGKSLLLHGLTHRVAERDGRSCLLACASDFSRQLKQAIDVNGLDDFRLEYRRPALLALDNIHELAGKQRAQEELVHTLDAIHDTGGQVLLAGRQAPAEISGFSRRLISRLEAGLVVPLTMPQEAARRQILEDLVHLHQLRLDPTQTELVISGLAQGPLRTVPQLQHAILQLKHLCLTGQHDTSGQRQQLDSQGIQAFLTEFTQSAQPTMRSICQHVCQYFTIRSPEIKGPTRRQNVVRARSLAMYLARQLTGHSYKQIGQYYRRDHTTVLHACRKTESLLSKDQETKQAVTELLDRIGASP